MKIKKYISYIRKEIKKNGELVIRYFPTEEEIEYLKKFNILTERKVIKQQGLIYMKNF